MDRQPDKENKNEAILRSLRRIIRAVDLHSRRLGINHGLTTPQLVSLLELKDKGPLTVAQLAHEVYLSASTMVGILDRLESKGLVHRERSTKDRRVVVVHITREGRRKLVKAPSPLQEQLDKGLGELNAREREQIARALLRIVELMEAEEVPPHPI